VVKVVTEELLRILLCGSLELLVILREEILDRSRIHRVERVEPYLTLELCKQPGEMPLVGEGVPEVDLAEEAE
jgi:hypothetical protein